MGQYNGYYANILDVKSDKVLTARDAHFFNGFTSMKRAALVPGVKGADALLEVTLNALVEHEAALLEGHQVDVHLTWDLSPDRSSYENVELVKVATTEPTF